MSTKILGAEIKRKGFLYTQVMREGEIAMYKVEHIRKSDYDKPYDAGYEVIVIDTKPKEKTLYAKSDVPYEKIEIYPSIAQWGRYGFSYTPCNGGYPAALKKFNQLIKLYN